MRPTTCSRCHSDRIMSNLRVGERGTGNIPMSIAVRVDEKPEALLFKAMHAQDLKAWVCGACGFTELYVENPQELYATYSKAGEWEPSQ